MHHPLLSSSLDPDRRSARPVNTLPGLHAKALPYLLFFPFGAMLLVLLLVPPIRRAAWRVGLVDRPRSAAHKSHRQATPYAGLAIGLAFSLALLALPVAVALTGWHLPPASWWRPTAVLILCSTAILLTGLLDDRRTLPALPRLMAQAVAGFALLWYCPSFRLPLGSGHWAPLAGTLLWILALTNAVNFLDNMDGLAAGMAALMGVLMAVMAWVNGEPVVFLLAATLTGALVGFLRYNLPPASVFMGDAGALFTGFVASSTASLLSRQLAQTPDRAAAWLAPLLLFLVPTYDLCSVTAIRIANRMPPWIGDNNHISHRLVALGLSRRGAVAVICTATLIGGLPALFLLRLAYHQAMLVGLGYLLVLVGVGGADAQTRRHRIR